MPQIFWEIQKIVPGQSNIVILSRDFSLRPLGHNQCWLILSCPLNYDQSNKHQFIFKNPYWMLVRNFWKLKVHLWLQKDFDPILTRCELTTAWAPLSRLEKFKVIEVLQKNKVPLTSSPELLIISWWVVEKIAQAAAQD